MSIYIYNSLSKKKEEFIPLNPPWVKMYTCGVTVYDECHLGHARSLYIFDFIRRYLKYKGFRVRFVRNITDIDDKIIQKAKELNLSAQEVSRRYIQSYYEDLSILGIEPADVEPKATENIPEMIKMIQVLIEKSFAYQINQDVYFSVRNFAAYGKLSGQGVDQMLSGARVEIDEQKHDPLDFALWKKAKPGEPAWPSPWGEGRPGWHIECSAMSLKYLETETLDIHAGGRDLIFPHHENEIAQAESFSGKPFAKYWIHHGLLTIHGQKMAKSLGNFITVKDFVQRYKDIDLLKLFFLSTHYASPIDYSEEKIEQAKKQKKNFYAFCDKVNFWSLCSEDALPQDTSTEELSRIEDICQRFQTAMDDDFNTPVALACLFELIDFASVLISSDKKKGFEYAYAKLGEFFSIFGLALKPKISLNPAIILLAQKRNAAKRQKKFQEADSLRKEIKEKFGYLTLDTAQGLTFIEEQND